MQQCSYGISQTQKKETGKVKLEFMQRFQRTQQVQNLHRTEGLKRSYSVIQGNLTSPGENLLKNNQMSHELHHILFPPVPAQLWIEMVFLHSRQLWS